jgi:hypothetical protein
MSGASNANPRFNGCDRRSDEIGHPRRSYALVWRALLARVLLTGIWLLPLGEPSSLAAGKSEEDVSTATESTVDAEQALRLLPDNTWYDQASNTYSPPEIIPERDNPLRQSGWLAKKKPAPAERTPWNWNWNLSGFIADWFSSVVIGVLGVLLVVIVVLLMTYFSMRNYMPGRFRRDRKSGAVKIDPTRVAALPFEVRSTGLNPLDEAEKLMRAERFDEAIVFLYGYLLLALDQARKIHLQKGKTNRMYLRELRSDLGLREITEAAMLAFEDVFFGKHSIPREQFMALWNRLDEFHQHLSMTDQPLIVPAISKAAPA